jgi:dihydrolipoamide dehydrogenase
MVVGALTADTDVVVIGAGPGGYVAAIRAAELGLDVLLIEETKTLGGICLNHGCIPTKAYVHASHILSTIKDAEKLGITTTGVNLDMPALRTWKDGVVTKLNQGISSILQKQGVEVIEGRGFFTSPNELHIEGKSDVTTIRFKHAIIATGSSPIEVSPFPYANPLVISSTEALQLDHVPKNMVIIGGGYIGIELGNVYAKLGTKVDILEMQKTILTGFDTDIIQIVVKKMTGIGITLHTNTSADLLEERSGQAVVHATENGEKKEFPADRVLVVVGRKPNTTFSITEEGSAVFRKHLKALERLLKNQ